MPTYIIYLIIIILMLLFGRTIIKYLDTTQNEQEITKKTKVLYSIILTLAGVYVISLFIDHDFLQNTIKSILTVMIAYIANAYIYHLIARIFGDIKTEIDGTTYFSEDYRADIFKAIASTFIIIITFLVILTVTGAMKMLNNYGVFGGFLIFLGFILPHFFKDSVAGIQLLASDRIRPGDVVSVPEKEICGFVAQITLSDVKFINLTDKHQITLAPAELRACTIHNYSTHGKSGLEVYVDIHVGYDVPFDTVQMLYSEAWNSTNQPDAKTGINYEKESRLEIENHGDHAIQYRCFYHILSARHLVSSKHIINMALMHASRNHNVGLNTPLTHAVLQH